MTTDDDIKTKATPQIGDALPNLVVMTTKGELNLSSLVNQALVIYFYPRDNTPKCTQESQDFARSYDRFFNQYKTEILGVSRDSLKSHEKFKQKYALPFALIADTNETLCHYFHVIKFKNMYGKKVRSIQRSTFIFDRQGKLYQSFREIKIDNHVENVLNAVKKLEY